MILGKSVTVFALAAVLIGASVKQSKAILFSPPPVATGAALSTGAALTVGFVGFVAVICVYDIWLKFNGYKNWDGTPKVVVVHQHHR